MCTLFSISTDFYLAFFIYFRELQENLIRSHSAGKTLCLIIVYVTMTLDIFIPTDYPLHLAFTVQ